MNTAEVCKKLIWKHSGYEFARLVTGQDIVERLLTMGEARSAGALGRHVSAVRRIVLVRCGPDDWKYVKHPADVQECSSYGPLPS